MQFYMFAMMVNGLEAFSADVPSVECHGLLKPRALRAIFPLARIIGWRRERECFYVGLKSLLM